MADKSSANAYWAANKRIITISLVIWFFCSFGFGIILRPLIAGIGIGGTDLDRGHDLAFDPGGHWATLPPALARPDVVPIIDQDGDIPGFYVASGFSGHGFGIGPGAGKAIAGMLTGHDSGIDLAPFRLSRFFDGTPIRPQKSV